MTTSAPDEHLATTAPPPVRVLHLHCGREYGGLERLLLCLAERRGEAPDMAPVFALGETNRLAREITDTGARVEILGEFRRRQPWMGPAVFAALWRVLGRERFDAVICHGSSALVTFRWLAGLRGLPVILWMHSDTKVRNVNAIEWLAGYSRPAAVICNSQFTQRSLPLLFRTPPPNTVFHCPVVIPPETSDCGERRAQLRAEQGAADGDAVIILPSRLTRWKGHLHLLDALGRLRDLPGWKCWLVGGGSSDEQRSFLDELRAAAGRSGISDRVTFLGQRSDVPDLLVAADIFCQPNLSPEPFGINAVEALYAGLPVVASDSGGTREIVDETCGRLLRPGDVDALASTLGDLIRRPELRAALAANAPARGRAVSDPARILPRLHREIAKLVQTSPAASAKPEVGPVH